LLILREFYSKRIEKRKMGNSKEKKFKNDFLVNWIVTNIPTLVESLKKKGTQIKSIEEAIPHNCHIHSSYSFTGFLATI